MKQSQETHPGFGMISWSRQQWGTEKAHLFQSEMSHQHVVCIRVHYASRERDLHRDWVYPEKPIVEVCMTPAQFTQFITSPNTDGTPCTLTYTQKEGNIPLLGKQSRYHKFKQEIAEDVDEIAAQLETLQDTLKRIAARSAVRKLDIKAVQQQVDSLKTNLLSNIPYLKTQMEEHMNKVVEQGKVEIESYLQSRVQHLGLEAMAQSAPLLEEKTDGD